MIKIRNGFYFKDIRACVCSQYLAEFDRNERKNNSIRPILYFYKISQEWDSMFRLNSDEFLSHLFSPKKRMSSVSFEYTSRLPTINHKQKKVSAFANTFEKKEKYLWLCSLCFAYGLNIFILCSKFILQIIFDPMY